MTRYKGTCLYCGAPTFAHYKSKLKTFCSHTCSNRWKWENVRKRKTLLTFVCQNCGSDVLIDAADNRVKSGQQNFFCSNECWKEYCEKLHTLKTCSVCNNKFYGRNSCCCKKCAIEASKWHNFERYVGYKVNSYGEYLKEREKFDLIRKQASKKPSSEEEKREKKRNKSKNRRNNPEYVAYMKRYLKQYNAIHREERNIRARERMKNDEVYRFKTSVRKMICDSFSRKGLVKNRKSEKVLGCTIEEFMTHLESKFSDGMSFSNHGEWHIDHIIPLAVAKTEDDVIRLCHYTNLQPLWAKDNLSKGAKIKQ